MKISNWGGYPCRESAEVDAATQSQLASILQQKTKRIARAMGRCYGDSALFSEVLNTLRFNHFLAFDEASGIMRCEAGVTLSEVLSVCVPKGWFLQVTPGTQFVSVGGAIASDVHGKNHHHVGSFAESVLSFKIMIADGSILECNRQSNSALFYASLGGMGLTGVILSVELQLMAVCSPVILQEIFRYSNLKEALLAFDEHADWPYSVAWLDCVSPKPKAVLIVGKHADEGALPKKERTLSIPCYAPSVLLNPLTIKAFNFLHFYRSKQGASPCHFQPFFYPLDNIKHWNRLYGRRGFLQYQFVMPKAVSEEGLTEVLTKIQESKYTPFLTVLKLMGKGSKYLSFPIEGYSLALDFPMRHGLLLFLDKLDKLVVQYGGRVYLTKDARLSSEAFYRMYPEADQFLSVKKQYDPDCMFQSFQSQRLGLCY